MSDQIVVYDIKWEKEPQGNKRVPSMVLLNIETPAMVSPDFVAEKINSCMFLMFGATPAGFIWQCANQNKGE